MRTPRAIIAVGLLLAAPVAVHAAPPGAPPNDDYLSSFPLNAPGSKLERTDTLRDARETTRASVQSDVFAPPSSGGPAEVTTCGPASFGKTVWYDFHPDVPGVVRLRANGYNTVIAVMPFDPRPPHRPDFSRRQCANESTSTTEEFLVRVGKGKAYTVQIGGVGDTGGNLEFLFDFLADTDGDTVLDDVDACDRLKGASRNGCPPRLRASVTLRARPTANGIKIAGLRVKAPRRSRVSVRCGGCPPQAKRAKTVSFGRLRGRNLRAGTSLVIRVTRRNSIGAYVKYRITRGNFKKIERCLNPGSRKPRRRCG